MCRLTERRFSQWSGMSIILQHFRNSSNSGSHSSRPLIRQASTEESWRLGFSMLGVLLVRRGALRAPELLRDDRAIAGIDVMGLTGYTR